MESPDMSAYRREYVRGGLDRAVAGDDPRRLFALWMADAEAAGLPEPNAMVLATATPDGRPSARIVLAKTIDDAGIVFHTNAESRKGRELAANPRAALVFDWHLMERQVRVEGPVERVTDEESDAYFLTRPRGGQIGAWASRQSEPIEDRLALERQFDLAAAEIGDGPVTRPPHWGGFRMRWETVEFWQGRENRLHDRVVFTQSPSGWRVERLQP